jgi:putative hydrolase of HD superfamily
VSSTIQQVVDFILELDKLKGVTRKIRPLGLDRYENSAEHSWQLAMLAVSLAHFAADPIDVDHVIRMLLIHDVGEIDTGDTIVFAEGGWKERKAAELAAAVRIFGLLGEPQRSELIALWQEFESAETAEARFANAVDRAMPVLLNLANDLQSWRENDISYERVVQRVGPPIESGCPALWEHLRLRLQEARDNGWFGYHASRRLHMTDRIEKQIVIRAPRSRVWRSISDKTEFGAWFGVKLPPGSFAPGEKVSGNITYPGYEHLVMDIELVDVSPERHLSYRWHPYAIDPKVDYSSEPTTLVTFTLEDAPEGTLLTITESGFDQVPLHRRDEAFRMNESGWTEQLTNIERHVTASR